MSGRSEIPIEVLVAEQRVTNGSSNTPRFVARILQLGGDFPNRGGRVELYIGPEHDRTVRELEILVERFDDGREAVIFHVMSLGPKFTRYREEHSDD